MVAPLDNVRPIGQPPGTAAAGRTRGAAGDFDLSLVRAMARQDSPAPRPGGLVSGDDLLANIEQATQSLQRATAHINSARAYFRGASAAGAAASQAPSLDRGA